MSVLAQILATKRDEVAAARAARPWADVEAAAVAAMAAAPARGLAAALARPPGAPVRALAEVKRASPSAGPIRPGADPAAIAREYAAAGAAAISVLTDLRYFDGELAFLGRCRAAVSVPLLRKDFLIDPYQVAESRAAGADAVLLIAAALAPAQLAELHAAARAYGLDALVEVHEPSEVEPALAAGASLIGINHRDLRTMRIDMGLTEVVARQLPPGTVVVAESGIRAAADVARLGAAGAHAVLVGEHLMRQPSPGAALRALLGADASAAP